MLARERVMLALNHQEPDRIPIDLGGSICSSIHRNAYITLKQYLGMEIEDIQLVENAACDQKTRWCYLRRSAL